MLTCASVRRILSSPRGFIAIPVRTYAIGPATTPLPNLPYVPTTGTYPQGYRVGGFHCGVKKDGESLDLALVTSDRPASAAAVFTKNVFKAAPVIVSRDMLAKRGGKGVRALVVNSGCSNAVTGRGRTREVDQLLGTAEPSTLVMSTGVIGQRGSVPLPDVGWATDGADGTGYQYTKFRRHPQST